MGVAEGVTALWRDAPRTWSPVHAGPFQADARRVTAWMRHVGCETLLYDRSYSDSTEDEWTVPAHGYHGPNEYLDNITTMHHEIVALEQQHQPLPPPTASAPTGPHLRAPNSMPPFPHHDREDRC